MNLEKFSKQLLQEGGAAGHMKHPYDDLSVNGFIEFFDKLFNGELTATEKFDGYNLFVGINSDGEISAVRNKNEEPFTNVNERFRKQHGGRAAFLGGFKAIKSALQSLSKGELVKYQLIDEKQNPKNFINLEIIYGPQPNLIRYSEEKNFIVFHAHSGTKENGYQMSDDLDPTESRKLLRRLAGQLGSIVTDQSKAEYSGSDNVVRSFQPESSYWEFKGPTVFTGEQIQNKINPSARQLWERKKQELRELEKFNTQGDELKLKLKEISSEIGTVILNGLQSKLSDATPSDDLPGTEGLVIPYNGDMYKITGEFAELNQQSIRPPNFMSDLQNFIGNSILKIKLKTIDKKKVEQYGNISTLLKQRNPKMDYSQPLKEKSEIINLANKAIKDVKKFKQDNSTIDFVQRSMDAQIVDLQNFIEDVRDSDTLKDLAVAFFENLFWQKNKKLSENIFSKMAKELLI